MKQVCSSTWTAECDSAASYMNGMCQSHMNPT